MNFINLYVLFLENGLLNKDCKSLVIYGVGGLQRVQCTAMSLSHGIKYNLDEK